MLLRQSPALFFSGTVLVTEKLRDGSVRMTDAATWLGGFGGRAGGVVRVLGRFVRGVQEMIYPFSSFR